MMQRIEVKLAADDVDEKTGTFAGYGAVFGNRDSYGDVIERGAFKRTLREWEDRGKYPPMLLQHGGLGLNASDLLPIGKWTAMEENTRGLKVEGRLFGLESERGRLIHEGLREGALDGLSIGYRVRKDRRGTKPNEPTRTLEDVELVEVSLVTFPANERARVSAVKSFDPPPEFLREMEAALREAGLSRTDAKKAVACFRDQLRRDAEDGPAPRDEGGADEVAELIRRNIQALKTTR